MPTVRSSPDASCATATDATTTTPRIVLAICDMADPSPNGARSSLHLSHEAASRPGDHGIVLQTNPAGPARTEPPTNSSAGLSPPPYIAFSLAREFRGNVPGA